MTMSCGGMNAIARYDWQAIDKLVTDAEPHPQKYRKMLAALVSLVRPPHSPCYVFSVKNDAVSRVPAVFATHRQRSARGRRQQRLRHQT